MFECFLCVFCMFLIPIILTFIHFISFFSCTVRSFVQFIPLFFMTIFLSNDFVFFIGFFRYHFSFLVVSHKTKLDFIYELWLMKFYQTPKSIPICSKFYFNCAKCHWNKCIRKDIFHVIWILREQFESLFLRCCIGHLTYFIQCLQHEKLHDLHISIPTSLFILFFFFLLSIENIIVSTFVGCLSKPFAPRCI